MVPVSSSSISQRNWSAWIFEVVEEFDMKFWEFYESRRCDAQIYRNRVIYISRPTVGKGVVERDISSNGGNGHGNVMEIEHTECRK